MHDCILGEVEIAFIKLLCQCEIPLALNRQILNNSNVIRMSFSLIFSSVPSCIRCNSMYIVETKNGSAKPNKAGENTWFEWVSLWVADIYLEWFSSFYWMVVHSVPFLRWNLQIFVDQLVILLYWNQWVIDDASVLYNNLLEFFMRKLTIIFSSLFGCSCIFLFGLRGCLLTIFVPVWVVWREFCFV